MRRITMLCLFVAVACQAQFASADGLIMTRSTHSVAQTLDRLEASLRAKGMKVFARIDHSAGAKSVGTALRPTQLLIFGNPKIGSQLMTSQQSVAIDLPMKALAWEDVDGKVWLAYNDPGYLSARHRIKDRDAVVQKMKGALKKFVGQATKP
ncbi:MAG: DUF302 domain-containing protein [Acidiferrobacterales bacterium]